MVLRGEKNFNQDGDRVPQVFGALGDGVCACCTEIFFYLFADVGTKLECLVTFVLVQPMIFQETLAEKL